MHHHQLSRVRTGHGKPGKSWNFRISFSRPGNSCNLSVGHGKSWKRWLLKSKKKIGFICEENSKNMRKIKDDFQENVQFRSWKTWRSQGKGDGKSWNFKSSKKSTNRDCLSLFKFFLTASPV